MDPQKLSEIRRWWNEIVRWESKGKAIDVIAFADAAHEYIPILLSETERILRRDDKARQPHIAAASREIPHDTPPPIPPHRKPGRKITPLGDKNPSQMRLW